MFDKIVFIKKIMRSQGLSKRSFIPSETLFWFYNSVNTLQELNNK